ncbi:MAG: epoxyqueuosine reductase QueH, partial [Lachnospiraceae bacterium]|nr:epoxyqueuosine reductase QueH [Candidatus Equihabitans merdae]
TLYFEAVRGLEKCPERGERCSVCFQLRLENAALQAAEGGFDYMTTTLTISPLKDAALLNEIGQRVCQKAGVTWLPSDFKKKNGYLRSIQLSEEYSLYRQNYCGCVFSKAASCDNIKNNSHFFGNE